MREVYFVKYYDKGSTVMGADQVSAALAARGVTSRAIYPPEIASISGAVLVFIKTSKWYDLARARRRGNRTVLDVQDTVVFKRRIKNRWLYDGLIFKNLRQLRDFASPRQAAAVVYHQWDPRYRPHQAGERELKLAYLGLARSFSLYAQMPGVTCFDDDYFRRALDFNCHLSLRETRKDFLYKPNCKVSTAAACGANLISTPDVSTVELLGEDYPYYTEAALPAALATIERARAEIGGPAWREGLERMRAVRERTSIERIAEDYLRFFAELG
jgi:hypothetical protein